MSGTACWAAMTDARMPRRACHVAQLRAVQATIVDPVEDRCVDEAKPAFERGAQRGRWLVAAGGVDEHRPADTPSLGGGDRAGVRGALERVGALHLRKQRQQHHRKLRHRILRVGRVDPDWVGEVAHPDPPLRELVDQVQRVAHRPAEPIEGVHHDHVPLARVLEHGAQAGPVDGRPGLLIDVDPIAGNARLEQRLDLAVEVLLGGRHARVPELHDRERTGGRRRTTKPERLFGTKLWEGWARVIPEVAAERGCAFHFQGTGTLTQRRGAVP